MTDHRITLARGTLAMIDRGGWTDPCEVMVGMLTGALRQLLQLVDESSAAVEALEQVAEQRIGDLEQRLAAPELGDGLR